MKIDYLVPLVLWVLSKILWRLGLLLDKDKGYTGAAEGIYPLVHHGTSFTSTPHSEKLSQKTLSPPDPASVRQCLGKDLTYVKIIDIYILVKLM